MTRMSNHEMDIANQWGSIAPVPSKRSMTILIQTPVLATLSAHKCDGKTTYELGLTVEKYSIVTTRECRAYAFVSKVYLDLSQPRG